MRLGTAGILCGWALQGYSVVGHCRNTWPLSTAVRLLAAGEDNIDFKSNKPIARVRNNKSEYGVSAATLFGNALMALKDWPVFYWACFF